MKKCLVRFTGTVLLSLIIVMVIGQGHVVFAAKFPKGDIVEVINTGSSGLIVRDAPPPLLTISGTVRDKQGNPIANVLIVAQDVSTEIEVASTTSDDTGSYALFVPPGTYNLMVTPPPESEFAPTTISNIVITQDSVIDIVLVRIEEVVTLSGVILDRDGNPIPNQYVYVLSLIHI